MLTRFWIEFAREPGARMFGFHRIGVTAPSLNEALALVSAQVFHGRKLPPTREVIAGVDVANLDPEDVQENMGDPARAGVWFPLGFQDPA